jgi:hypothetical protein
VADSVAPQRPRGPDRNRAAGYAYSCSSCGMVTWGFVPCCDRSSDIMDVSSLRFRSMDLECLQRIEALHFDCFRTSSTNDNTECNPPSKHCSDGCIGHWMLTLRLKILIRLIEKDRRLRSFTDVVGYGLGPGVQRWLTFLFVLEFCVWK